MTDEREKMSYDIVHLHLFIFHSLTVDQYRRMASTKQFVISFSQLLLSCSLIHICFSCCSGQTISSPDSVDGSIFPHVVTKLLLGPARAKAGAQGKSEIDECLGTFLETPLLLAGTKAGEYDSRHPSPSQGQRDSGAHIATPPIILLPVGLQ